MQPHSHAYSAIFFKSAQQVHALCNLLISLYETQTNNVCLPGYNGGQCAVL